MISFGMSTMLQRKRFYVLECQAWHCLKRYVRQSIELENNKSCAFCSHRTHWKPRCIYAYSISCHLHTEEHTEGCVRMGFIVDCNMWWAAVFISLFNIQYMYSFSFIIKQGLVKYQFANSVMNASFYGSK